MASARTTITRVCNCHLDPIEMSYILLNKGNQSLTAMKETNLSFPVLSKVRFLDIKHRPINTYIQICRKIKILKIRNTSLQHNRSFFVRSISSCNYTFRLTLRRRFRSGGLKGATLIAYYCESLNFKLVLSFLLSIS